MLFGEQIPSLAFSHPPGVGDVRIDEALPVCCLCLREFFPSHVLCPAQGTPRGRSPAPLRLPLCAHCSPPAQALSACWKAPRSWRINVQLPTPQIKCQGSPLPAPLPCFLLLLQTNPRLLGLVWGLTLGGGWRTILGPSPNQGQIRVPTVTCMAALPGVWSRKVPRSRAFLALPPTDPPGSGRGVTDTALSPAQSKCPCILEGGRSQLGMGLSVPRGQGLYVQKLTPNRWDPLSHFSRGKLLSGHNSFQIAHLPVLPPPTPHQHAIIALPMAQRSCTHN